MHARYVQIVKFIARRKTAAEYARLERLAAVRYNVA